MTDENRIRELLEELLESGRTPDEVCAEFPELLPELVERWRQVRLVERQLDELFPDSHAAATDGLRPLPDEKPILARRISAFKRLASCARQRPAAATLLVLLGLLLGAIVVTRIWLR